MKLRKLLQPCLASIIVVSVGCLINPRAARGDSNPGPVIQTVTTSATSMKVVLEILRDNGVVANYEGGLRGDETDRRIALPTGAVSIDRFIKAVTEGFRCKAEREAGVLTFFDADARKDGREDTLNAMIDDMKLDNTQADDAVNMIAERLNVKIACMGMSMISAIPGKPVSLKLHQITVRNALDQIAKAAGLFGWQSISQKMSGGDSIINISFIVF